LQDLTAAQIGNGIRNLPHHPSDFPPNPGQFKDLCMNNFDWETRAQRTAPPPIMLEDETTKAAKLVERKAQLAKLRASTGI
jgi:hypothetical protein